MAAGKLLLIGEDQRRCIARQLRHRQASGTWLPVVVGHIELANGGGVRLETGIGFKDDAILVCLRIDRADLSLSERRC